MTCKFCGYTWKTRSKHPKKCPNPLCQAILGKYPDPDKQAPKTEIKPLPYPMPSPEVQP